MKRYAKPLLALALLAAIVLVLRLLPIAQWLGEFQQWVRNIGPIGFVIYALVYAVCCVFLIPASVLTLGAGAIFGFAAGSIVVICGATLGAIAAFFLARTVLRHRVERMTANNAKFRALDRAISGEGTKILWLVRLSGFPPFTWVNYAFGLTGVRALPYALITMIGIIPGTLAFTWAGAAGASALTGRGNRLLLIVTAIGAIVVSAFIARIALEAIRKAGVDAA